MTIDEAIRILETGSVMPEFLYTAGEFGEACTVGIAALRAQQASAEETAAIVHCRDCRLLYTKDMSAYCPHRAGPCRADGFCERGVHRRKPEGGR